MGKLKMFCIRIFCIFLIFPNFYNCTGIFKIQVAEDSIYSECTVSQNDDGTYNLDCLTKDGARSDIMRDILEVMEGQIIKCYFTDNGPCQRVKDCNLMSDIGNCPPVHYDAVEDAYYWIRVI